MTTTLPPVHGDNTPHYDGRYRLWTINEIPFDRLPDDGGPALVVIDGWCVSYPSLCKWMSSPSVAEADDGKVTLTAFRPISDNPYRSERHELDGTKYDAVRDAQCAAYEAGLLAFMLYLKDEQHYGIGESA